MGKSSPSVPTAPDPAETAKAQGGVNRETAIAQRDLNMFDEYTPYGSSVFTPIGPTGQQMSVLDQRQATINAQEAETANRAKYDAEKANVGFIVDPSTGSRVRDSDYDYAVSEGRAPPAFRPYVPLNNVSGPSGAPGSNQDAIQRYARTTTLDPGQQKIFDQQTGITGDLNELASSQIGRVSNALSQPFSYAGMPAAPEADAAARQQTIDAIYGQAQSRLDPRFEQEQRALETRLATQGIGLGSDAYDSAFGNFGRTKNDAYGQANRDAIMGGGAEQSRLFGLQGNARERAIQEAAYLRNQPLNEVAALMGTGPGLSNPQFSAAPNTALGGVDYAGLVNNKYQGDMNAYNQKVSSNNATTGALFGLAGAGLKGYLGGPAFGVGGMFGGKP